jgi:glycosyltransferase involved in cell wall biosynthesis
MEHINQKKKNQSIAVVIPARNSMPLVIETLNSLANQIEMPDEIILSDNFSSDGTAQSFKHFAENTLGAKYVRSSKYLEFGPSFNFAISHSQSDWVFFLHSDDLLSRYAVKNIRKAIRKADELTGVISFKAEIISEDSKLKRAAFSIGRTRYEFGNDFILKNLRTSTINFGAVAINRRIFYELDQFDEKNSYWLDLKYFHKIALKYKILRVPASVLRYRKYSYERSADNRIEIDQKNEIYWNQKYLPSLFKENPSLSLEFTISKNQISGRKVVSFHRLVIMFMEILLTRKFFVLSLVKFRIFLDKLGAGNFGRIL